MAAAQRVQRIELARSLPQSLLKLFTRFPTPELVRGTSMSPFKNPYLPPRQTITTAETTPPSDATASIETSEPAPDRNPVMEFRNPFRRLRSTETRKIIHPHYTRREEAKLVKMAEHYGVEEFLPATEMLASKRAERRAEARRLLKGTAEGGKVKGHAWERGLRAKQEKRRQAMIEMPALIEEWRRQGHGRFWKKFPK